MHSDFDALTHMSASSKSNTSCHFLVHSVRPSVTVSVCLSVGHTSVTLVDSVEQVQDTKMLFRRTVQRSCRVLWPKLTRQ